MVPVRERAAEVCLRLQIGSQPVRLRRSAVGSDVAVQRDDVPGAEIEAVIALTEGAGILAKVLEVWRGSRCCVVVIAGRRSCAELEAAPRGLVAVLEVRACA